MPDRPIVLVLGGGIGGLAASNLIREKVGERARVVLVDRKRHFQFPPSFPWLAMNMRRPAQVQKDLRLLKKKGIEVVTAEVSSIDLESKRVGTEHEELPYDYLVIALGAEYDPNLIPGFRQNAYHVYDLDSAVRFREAIAGFMGGTIAIGVARTPFKCPAAPYEMALLLDDYFTKRGLRGKIRLVFFTPEPAPLPSVGPSIGAMVLELLKSRGVDYHSKSKVVRIDSNALHSESGETIAFDLLFCVPPHQAPKPVVQAGLTDDTGWIPVDTGTFETKTAGVYAIGDVTSVPTPKGYVPFLPKAGVFAHSQAEVVAHNLGMKLRRRGSEKRWDGHGACFLEVGDGKSAFVKGKFLAEPRPEIDFREPARIWHLQKILFEKYWMHHWF